MTSNPTPFEPKLASTSYADKLKNTPHVPAGIAPVGTPQPLAGPLVWSGSDFPDASSYTLRLTAEHMCEIEEALAKFKALELDGDDVSRCNFPLPKLGNKLQACSDALHNGRGFFVISRLDMGRYSVEDSVVIYLGIASYIGDERGLQDGRGNVLAHITSSKLWDVPLEKRHGIHSNLALPFHTDMGADILALQVRHSAHKGGSTFVSSAASAFNRLLSEEPAVVRTLMDPNWPVQYTGRNNARHYLAPVMTMHQGRLMTSMDPTRFGPHPASEGSSIPLPSRAQKHALQRMDEAAASTELALHLQSGDVLFLNNWALLHRRAAYEDDDATSRHLVRLWLRSTDRGWSVPVSMALPWQTAYGHGSRARIYAMQPSPRYTVPKYTVGSAAFLFHEEGEEADD